MDGGHIAIFRALVPVALAASVCAPGTAQDLVPGKSLEGLAAGTVQETAFLPGTAANPAGWAVLARTNAAKAPTLLQGVTFVNLDTMATCDLDLGEDVQDVEVFEGRVYATLGETGTIRDALATIDPGPDPCASPPAVLDRAAAIHNATNVRVGRAFGSPHALLANSLRIQDCQPPNYTGEDLAVYLYDVGTFSLVSTWIPGEDGSGFSRNCDQCGPLCGPEDIVVWNDPQSGTRWMAVAALLDGLYLVDVTDPLAPRTAAHLGYTFDGRDAQGNPRPDLPNLTQDVEVSRDRHFLITTDQQPRGGHLIVWRIEDIVAACSDPLSPCGGRDVTPAGEYFPDGTPPGFAHKMLPDWPYLWLTYFDYGAVLLDFGDPTAPREVARRDVLASHPLSTLSNQPFGAYGAALARPCNDSADTSDLIVSDRGVFDRDPNNGSRTITLVPGGMELLHWEGTATPAGPLLLARDPATLPGEISFSWTRAPLASDYHLYEGTIPATPAPLTLHAVPDPSWCGLACCEAALPDPAPLESREYFLLGARDACGRLGSLGGGGAGPRPDPEPAVCP